MFSGMIPGGYRNERISANKYYEKKVTNVQLELSLLILKHFDVVMILSEWDQQSVQLQRYGVRNISLPKRNENLKKPTEPMSDEIKEYLESVNVFDLQFYKAVREIATEKTMCAEAQPMRR